MDSCSWRQKVYQNDWQRQRYPWKGEGKQRWINGRRKKRADIILRRAKGWEEIETFYIRPFITFTSRKKFFSCWAIREKAGLIKGFSFQQELMSSYLKNSIQYQTKLSCSWYSQHLNGPYQASKRWFWTHDNNHRKDHILAECDICFDVQIVFKSSRLIQRIVLIFNEKKLVSADLARLCWKSKTLFNYF